MHPSYGTSDSPRSGNMAALAEAVGKAAGKEALTAALGGVAAGVPWTSMVQQRRLRELAAHLGVPNAKEPTFKAMSAVLDQIAHPGSLSRDQDFWDAYEASRSNFQWWKPRLRQIATASPSMALHAPTEGMRPRDDSIDVVCIDGIIFRCQASVASSPQSPPPLQLSGSQKHGSGAPSS